VRATSPPTAPTVACAALALAAATLVPPALPSGAAAERWQRPVPGEVARAFDYSVAAPFAAGAHRGVDLRAAPGSRARAACGGRVMFAGPVAGAANVVSVLCGGRRVSYLPLARISVHSGETVLPGAPLGTLARGHNGALHLGVRRAADRFAYEDPLPLLDPAAGGRPLAPARRRPQRPRPAAPRAPAPHATAPRTHPATPPRRIAQPRANRPTRAPAPAGLAIAPGELAPWPAWVGLALLLAGTSGSGTLALRRRRRRAARRLRAQQPDTAPIPEPSR
jgi:Peptidase family M23